MENLKGVLKWAGWGGWGSEDDLDHRPFRQDGRREEDCIVSDDRTGTCLGTDMTISAYYFGIFKIIMHPF